MRRALASFLAAAMLASPVEAATALRLRAGEHGAYSRVVAPSLGPAPLVLASGREISLIFDASVGAVDLTEITDGRASRIAGASEVVSDGKLIVTLALNCDCTPKLSSGADQALVLDIHGAAPAVTAAAPVGKETEAERARTRLMTAIAGASSSGVVRLKGAAAEDATGDLHAPTPLAAATLPAPESLAQTPVEARDCSLESDLLVASADDRNTEDMAPNADALALSYLKRGFFAESYAVAKAGDAADRLVVIAAVAGALDGRAEPQADVLSAFASCGPVHRIMRAAALSIEAPDQNAEFLGDEIGVLKKMPAPLRFSLAEALAHAARKKDQGAAALLAAIARNAQPSRASVKLDIVEAAAGKSDGDAQDRLAKAARDPGADQLQALEALGEAAPAARNDAIADLSLAARLSYSDGARLRAAELAAELLVASGRHVDAVGVFASAHFDSAEAARSARNAAAAALLHSVEKGAGADVVAVAAGFLAHRAFLADAEATPALRLALAKGLAPLGDRRIAEELLGDERISATDRAGVLDETSGPAPRAVTRPDFAAFANERLAVSANDPDDAVRQARRLDEEAALMRKALEGAKPK